jgi:hypothetical protein
MALYELVIDQRYYNQQCINRYNFTSTGTPAAVLGAFALTSGGGFIADAGVYPVDTFFYNTRRVQNAGVAYQQIIVKNIYDPTDFYALPYITPIFGLRDSGNQMSPSVASGIRSNQVRTDVGRGYKRFVGLSEGDVDQGGVIGTDMTTLLVELCTRYNAPITYDDEGNTLTFTQVIVSKEKYVPDPLKPTKFAYKYYDTLAEQLDHVAAGIQWQPYTTQRTQTSRQYGKGS